MAMSAEKLLTNHLYFPTYFNLPIDTGLDLRYFGDPYGRDIFRPIKHWCLLVEIVEIVPYPFRPMWNCRDKAGKALLIAFHLPRDQTVSRDFMKHAKPGNTMSFMYAQQHFFVDGQVGIRVEDASGVKTYPCGLDAFFDLEDRANNLAVDNTKCQACGSAANLQCSSCSVKYCNKECQSQDWHQRHKRECRALKQINDWKGRNWAVYHDGWL